MRPIFTIHAGEFIFGETLQKRSRDIELWIPVKDKGVDFLVTKPNRDKPISVQVKLSRIYSPNVATTDFHRGLIAGGFFTLNHEKLAKSTADIWSLILVPQKRQSEPFFINIPPQELLKRLVEVFGKQKSYRSYPSVLKFGKGPPKCIEVRGLKQSGEEDLASSGRVEPLARDWTQYYDDWSAFDG